MLLISLLAWGGTELYARAQVSKTVLVTDGAGKKHSYSLEQEASHLIETSLGTNLISIENNSVHVEQASCPNLNCIHQGTIGRAGQTIVCLPNELVITIGGEDSSRPDVDTVAR